MAGLFARDLSTPVERWGHQFDSVLEANVASDLDDIGLGEHWGHHVPSGFPVYYEPDFTIVAEGCMNPECPVCDEYEWKGDYLELPKWVEVKPREMLYAVRDWLGLDERFDRRVKATLTANQLDTITGGELGKVKLLAESSGESVLVVDQMNRNHKLSITITPEDVRLQWDHPAVSHKTFLKDCDYYIRALDRAVQSQYLEAERERRRAQFAADRLRRAELWIDAFRRSTYRRARYPGRCVACGQQNASEKLVVAHIGEQFRVMCESHL